MALSRVFLVTLVTLQLSLLPWAYGKCEMSLTINNGGGGNCNLCSNQCQGPAAPAPSAPSPSEPSHEDTTWFQDNEQYTETTTPALSGQFDVTLYELAEFQGKNMHLNGDSCHNLHYTQCGGYDIPGCIADSYWLSSLKTKTCVKLYSEEFCAGNSIQLEEGHRCLNSLSQCAFESNGAGNWDDKTKSIGPC